MVVNGGFGCSERLRFSVGCCARQKWIGRFVLQTSGPQLILFHMPLCISFNLECSLWVILTSCAVQCETEGLSVLRKLTACLQVYGHPPLFLVIMKILRHGESEFNTKCVAFCVYFFYERCFTAINK
jgi:hypothetical protein